MLSLSANRSVVLLRLNEYEKCLSDISAALHFGYPDNLQYKLYERQGTCLQALGYVSAYIQIMFDENVLTGIIMKLRKAMKKPWNFLKLEKSLRAKNRRSKLTCRSLSQRCRWNVKTCRLLCCPKIDTKSRVPTSRYP